MTCGRPCCPTPNNRYSQTIKRMGPLGMHQKGLAQSNQFVGPRVDPSSSQIKKGCASEHRHRAHAGLTSHTTRYGVASSLLKPLVVFVCLGQCGTCELVGDLKLIVPGREHCHELIQGFCAGRDVCCTSNPLDRFIGCLDVWGGSTTR